MATPDGVSTPGAAPATGGATPGMPVVRYPSPVETGGRDEIADLAPDEFFERMPAVDAQRG